MQICIIRLANGHEEVTVIPTETFKSARLEVAKYDNNLAFQLITDEMPVPEDIAAHVAVFWFKGEYLNGKPVFVEETQ